MGLLDIRVGVLERPSAEASSMDSHTQGTYVWMPGPVLGTRDAPGTQQGLTLSETGIRGVLGAW